MNMTQRLTVWLFVMLLGMSGICLWSWQQMQTQHRIAQMSANDDLQSQAFADEITHLQNIAHSRRPDEEMNTLVQMIQQAAKQAAIPMSHVQRIRPSAERRMAQSPYVQKPTQLSLNSLTLPKAVAFLHHLATLQQNLHIQSIRITAPRNDLKNNTDTWQFEVGLANIIYSPQTDKSH